MNVGAAVITAGGNVDGEFARTIGTRVKALAPVNGARMVERSIAAARNAGVERIALVGGPEVRDTCGSLVDRFIDAEEDGTVNLRRALFAWGSDVPLVYLTSDLPFITGPVLRAFIDEVPDGTLALPLTEWRDFARRFENAPPFGVTIGGERVVNGGAFAIPAGAATRVEAFAVRFFDARKSLFAMARLLGPALMLQFFFRRLSVRTLEAQAERLIGVPAKAVRNAAPELAYDVDTFEEYLYAAKA